MKLNSTMRLTVLCLAAATVSASYEGFFGKPTSNVESNEKTRRIEQQLRQSFGGDNRKLKNGNAHLNGPRGAKAKPEDEQVDENGRALKYYYPEHYYYEPEPYSPYYYEPEYPVYYEPEPYYAKYPKYKYPYYKSKKSKKGGKMGGGKMWMGKGKMSWKKWQNKWHKLPPKIPMPTDDHILDMVFQDDEVFGDILDDEDCELFVAAEAFHFGGYTATVPITLDGTTDGQVEAGTTYLWQPDYMGDRFTEDLIDAQFSGSCVLTSLTAAYCNFVIVNNVGDQITLAGTLDTPTSSLDSAGTLAITGGTGAMAGVIGEATVYANPIGRNVFELATRFDVDVILGVIVCKPQALPVY